MRHHTKLLQQFTRKWREEYLTGLRERKQPGKGVSERDCISIGDVVILKKDFTPRSFSKLAKVEQLVKGSDGRVRAAVVKVARSNNKRPVYCVELFNT